MNVPHQEDNPLLVGNFRYRLLCFLLGLSIILAQAGINPAFSQTSLNSCFTSAAAAQQCQSAGLITPQAAANSIRTAISNPNPINSFWTGSLPSPEAIAVVGGVAALGYLSTQNMQDLQNRATSAAAPPFTGGQMATFYNVTWRYVFKRSGLPDDIHTGTRNNVRGRIRGTFNRSIVPISSTDSRFKGDAGIVGTDTSGNPQDTRIADFAFGGGLSLDFQILSVVRSDGQPDTGGNLQVPLATAAAALPQAGIYAAAAAAAAATAANTNNTDDARAAAATAAIEAANFVSSDSTASQPDKDIAAAAAATAAAAKDAIAASVAAKAQAKSDAKSLYPDFPESQTAIAPATGYTSNVNWLAYGISVFSNKFPFDLFSGTVATVAPECPSVTFFTKSFELCPIRDLIGFLRIPVIIGFLIWSFMSI
jgi:hypothetical protein